MGDMVNQRRRAAIRRIGQGTVNTGVVTMIVAGCMLVLSLVGHVVVELLALAFAGRTLYIFPRGGDPTGLGSVWDPVAPWLIQTGVPFSIAVFLLGLVAFAGGAVAYESSGP